MRLLKDVGIWLCFVFVGLVAGVASSVFLFFPPPDNSVETEQTHAARNESTARSETESPGSGDARKLIQQKARNEQNAREPDQPEPATNESSDESSSFDQYVPLPHLVPQDGYYRDGLSLRMSMVHDVVLERYPQHSKEWYRKRNRRSRKRIERLREQGSQSALFDAYDNLAVGLDRLNRSVEAVEILREKKRLQKQNGLSGQDLYTTHANLSTHLIHANFSKAMKGDTEARQKVKEALGYLKKASQQKLGTYFGREVWQEVAVRFFLAASENPDLLLTYDFVGNRLSDSVAPSEGKLYRNLNEYLNLIRGRTVRRIRNPGSERNREILRSYIARIERSPGYLDRFEQPQPSSVPFDEPTLAIIGMWRLGGGPNPHFALALGELMLRVGQKKRAWEAYERALRMDPFWHKDEIHQQLAEHCRQRQLTIEKSLANTTGEELRADFDQEWERAMTWRKKYQEFERKRLETGYSIENENFHAPFFGEHDHIASSSGTTDWYKVDEATEFEPIPKEDLPELSESIGGFGRNQRSLVPKSYGSAVVSSVWLTLRSPASSGSWVDCTCCSDRTRLKCCSTPGASHRVLFTNHPYVQKAFRTSLDSTARFMLFL